MKKMNKILSTVLAGTIALSGLTAFAGFAEDEVRKYYDPENGVEIPDVQEYWMMMAHHHGPWVDSTVEGNAIENCVEKYGTFILAEQHENGDIEYKFNLKPVEGEPSKGIHRALTYCPSMKEQEFEQYKKLCDIMNATGAENYGYLLDDYKHIKPEYVDILKKSEDVVYCKYVDSYMLLGTLVSKTTHGDVNLNGKIDTIDALAILKDIVQLLPEQDEIRYKEFIDYNKDGKINSNDALGVLKYVVGLE